MGFPLRAWVKKAVYAGKIYWLSGKDKVPGAMFNKKKGQSSRT